MRKPRDFDAKLKMLSDRARQLKENSGCANSVSW